MVDTNYTDDQRLELDSLKAKLEALQLTRSEVDQDFKRCLFVNLVHSSAAGSREASGDSSSIEQALNKQKILKAQILQLKQIKLYNDMKAAVAR